MKEKFSLKDHLFKPDKIYFLAEKIVHVYPAFKKDKFIKEILDSFPNLELKERITHIRICLEHYLPKDYLKALEIILQALPEPLDNSLKDNDFGDFIYAPFHDYVAHNGCTKEHLKTSLSALKELTKRFSAEDAIRYFINAFPKETIETLKIWSTDENYHVRRLCSEGTRPALPWAKKIKLDVLEALPILDTLYSDSTRYVTRSVANHLNDLSKINPDLVIDLLEKWKTENKQSPEELNYIIKHALRTLIKKGHSRALTFLGFGESVVHLSDLKFFETVSIGQYQEFSFEIYSPENQKIVVDYILYFQNKQGKMQNKKVYKIQSFQMKEEETKLISKKHYFKSDMSTRILYNGIHQIDIQVNGEILTSFTFDLI